MASARCSGQGPKVCGATTVFRGTTEDDRKEATHLKDHTHLRLSRATPAAEWYDEAMVTFLTIEPLSDRHGGLIVAAFNKLFIDGGGQPDGFGDGWNHGWGNGGDGGNGGNGDGDDDDDKCPEEWRAE